MKLSITIVLIFLISAVVSAGVFFAIRTFDTEQEDELSQIAALTNKIDKLHSEIENLKTRETLTEQAPMQSIKPGKSMDEIAEEIDKSKDEDAQKLKSLEKSMSEIEKRLANLEQKTFVGTGEFTEKSAKSELFKQAVRAEIKDFFTKMQKESRKKQKEMLMKKFMKKYTADVKNLAKMLGLSDAQVEQLLEAGREHIEKSIELHQQYSDVDIASLPIEQQEQIKRRFAEQNRSIQKKLREVIGDDNYRKIRTMQRKEEFLKQMHKGRDLGNIEQWQIDKFNEALERHLEETSYLDMKLMTEDLSPEERTQLKKEIRKSRKFFEDEVANQILTPEQRKQLEKK